MDIQRERDRSLSASSSAPISSQLKKLLEARFRNGTTALLLSCYRVEYAIIEMLIDAGAHTASTDLEENTAIHMLAACLRKESIPSKEIFPFISQVKQPIYLKN